MPKREVEHHGSPRDVPPVGRPRGAVWRALQADGVVWEGQVSLVGDDLDLAARMIVTHRRVVFVRGGEVTLDVPREWLRPEPVLRRDGVLDLFVTMPGGNLFDEPMTIPIRMREGHPAAGHIIAMLAPGGVRRILPETLSGMERAREAAPVADFKGFWDVDDLDPSWDSDERDPGHADASARNGGSGHAEASDWLPIEPPDRVVRVPSSPPRRPLMNGYPITGLQPRAQRKSPWGLFARAAALVLLLATAAALGAGRLNLIPPGGGSSDAILTGPSPTVAAVASPSPPAEAALAPTDEAAIAIGVGGATEPDSAPTSSEAMAAQAATEPPPAAEPTATVSPTAIVIPTPAPTAAPAAAATAATTPAVAPESAETSDAAEGAATPAAEPPAAQQPAAVNANAAPAQELVTGSLRVSVSSAQRAESLPRYGLPPGSGEWILLLVEVRNEGDAPAAIAMNDFRLYDREPGTTIALDSGTDVIAGLAGFDPPRSPDDEIAVAPGESTEALLLFQLPPGSSDNVALIAGETAMELAPSLAETDATVAAAPELMQAKVSDVLDGSRIVVDVSGSQQTVQYLGMEAPVAGACFAGEAADANRQLVEGQTVWLEREASDRSANDELLRDVWIAGQDGNRVLVSARLLEAGAGVAAAASPDTRYQAWLQSASALARSNNAGLWGDCPDAATS